MLKSCAVTVKGIVEDWARFKELVQEALDANRTDPCDFCAEGALAKQAAQAEAAAEEVPAAEEPAA